MLSKYLTVREVSDLISVKDSTIRKWCRTGDFDRVHVTYKKVMNQWMIEKSSLDRWFNNL